MSIQQCMLNISISIISQYSISVNKFNIYDFKLYIFYFYLFLLFVIVHTCTHVHMTALEIRDDNVKKTSIFLLFSMYRLGLS
jgi:hypothetical protein